MTTAVRLGLILEIAVAKVGKYATSESGDTVEVVERPHGGLSVVLVDGQRSGKSAKAISNMVARKAMALLADGVRDGAVARAAHDYLRTQRGGKVSATLNLVSVDLASRTLVLLAQQPLPHPSLQPQLDRQYDTRRLAVSRRTQRGHRHSCAHTPHRHRVALAACTCWR